MPVGHKFAVFLALVWGHVHDHKGSAWLENSNSFVDCFLWFFEVVENQQNEGDINNIDNLNDEDNS